MASNNALNQTSPNFTVNQITINNAPVVGTDGTNKTYVDMIAAGFEFKNACLVGTTAALTATYANGAAGVGATLTNAGAMAAFSVDGVSPVVNSRVLVKNQASALQNGIYTLTTVGSGASNWVLTRATDYDEPAEIHAGDIVPVEQGTLNATTLWLQTATVVTIGVDSINFSQFFGGGINTISTDSGTVTASGGTISAVGGGNITTTGAGSTLTIKVSGTTNHNVQVGNASGTLTSVAPSATSGVPLISQGAAADPAFGTAVVAGGGTGDTSFTAYAVICGGTTSTNPLQSIAGVGTSGQLLTSNGAGALPTFQNAAASSISITGNTGGALTGNSFTFSGGTTGLSFGGAGTTETLTFAGITANAGVVSLGTDSTDNAINIGTAASAGRTITIGNATGTSSVAINCGTGGVTVGTSATAHTTTVGSTNSTSATTIQSGSGALNVTSTNGALTINSGTGALGISTDASATTVSFATGGAVKTVTLGSINSTSATTVQSGSGALNVTSTNGALTINSGTGALGISTDASATTVSFATGGAVKTVTLGSTNTTSSTAIKSGSGNVAINSGLTIDSSGRNYNTVQPAFSAYLTTSQNNVTGDGTTATVISDTELFDQGSNYNNATGIFTAPITGRYFFNAATQCTTIIAQTGGYMQLTATSHTFVANFLNAAAVQGAQNLGEQVSAFINMTAGDTCKAEVTYSGSTKTVNIGGNSFFAGYLVC